MKKKLLIIIPILILLGCIITLISIKISKEKQVKNAIIIVDYIDDLNVEFLSEVKVSDFITNINGKILDDYEIDTTKLGEQKITFEYLNDDKIKIKQDFVINVIDTVPPVVWLGSSYTVNVGSNINLTDKIMCGDNYDNNPTCEIIGEYNLNEAKTYPLVFKATDSSGNITEKSFNLYVKKPTSGGSNNTGTKSHTLFSDVITNYKNENTEIGLDLSEWQGDLDFNKLKNAGVEFVILRVGSTHGIKGDYFIDKQFVNNIKKANEVGIPVGIYFYSYADSKEKAIKDANWVMEQIKDYQVDLPIAFDWENWSFYNEFNLSFFGLTDMATSFLNVFKEKGYEGMIYSSKTYLEQIWLKTDYPVWLAHYAKKTTYAGDYSYWQLCSDGKVDGIYGDVDINIRYK